ncbi:thiamine phosphate synthase [Qipengyuania aurantiaca]|uniref:Thiamine phosphate synthase n=1 Tax=Qipengyuania aurantiaca TaxID=2867233 RepID=A0ABX8ZTV4_9SPHN|nr:thiamine phosphate synthase [Qipengyuania aurantiaca]QZD91063.1 thiamine phosphate synthase [Qipengyuania aurantiaca]
MAARYSASVTNRQTLPLLWLLSDARNDAGLEVALHDLPQGSGFVFRHYHLPEAARRERFEALAARARSCGHVVILSGPGDWGVDGHYGRPACWGAGLKLATAHNGDEIEAALATGADGIFLSPVFPTRSHPGAATLGVMGFRVLAQQSPVPVIALGGMTRMRAEELDWPRWGAIDGLASPNGA